MTRVTYRVTDKGVYMGRNRYAPKDVFLQEMIAAYGEKNVSLEGDLVVVLIAEGDCGCGH